MNLMSIAAPPTVCAACGAFATHTAPLSSRWRRVHPAGRPTDVRLAQVPEPPVCEFHWEAFLHHEKIPIGWCIDCEQYGTLGTTSPCGHNFEPFVS